MRCAIKAKSEKPSKMAAGSKTINSKITSRYIAQSSVDGSHLVPCFKAWRQRFFTCRAAYLGLTARTKLGYVIEDFLCGQVLDIAARTCYKQLGFAATTSAGYDWAWESTLGFTVKALEFNDLLVRHPCSTFYSLAQSYCLAARCHDPTPITVFPVRVPRRTQALNFALEQVASGAKNTAITANAIQLYFLTVAMPGGQFCTLQIAIK